MARKPLAQPPNRIRQRADIKLAARCIAADGALALLAVSANQSLSSIIRWCPTRPPAPRRVSRPPSPPSARPPQGSSAAFGSVPGDRPKTALGGNDRDPGRRRKVAPVPSKPAPDQRHTLTLRRQPRRSSHANRRPASGTPSASQRGPPRRGVRLAVRRHGLDCRGFQRPMLLSFLASQPYPQTLDNRCITRLLGSHQFVKTFGHDCAQRPFGTPGLQDAGKGLGIVNPYLVLVVPKSQIVFKGHLSRPGFPVVVPPPHEIVDVVRRRVAAAVEVEETRWPRFGSNVRHLFASHARSPFSSLRMWHREPPRAGHVGRTPRSRHASYPT